MLSQELKFSGHVDLREIRFKNNGLRVTKIYYAGWIKFGCYYTRCGFKIVIWTIRELLIFVFQLTAKFLENHRFLSILCAKKEIWVLLLIHCTTMDKYDDNWVQQATYTFALINRLNIQYLKIQKSAYCLKRKCFKCFSCIKK